MRKPVEIERQMVAACASDEDIAQARKQLNDAARRRFPEYRYASERQYTERCLLHVCRTYEYCRWYAFKYWVKCLFAGQQEESCQG